MEEVRIFLLQYLKKAGIDEEFITSMEMTTDDLGLGSLELVNLSVAVFDNFNVQIKLVKGEGKTLQAICEEIVANK